MFKRNQKEYERLSDHIGLVPLVMVTPSDIMLITEGSEERRKMVDAIISQFNKSYLEQLIRYNKTLAQRNKLLKDFNNGMPFNKELIETYNIQLSSYGQAVYNARKAFISDFMPVFNQYYQYISGNQEVVGIDYESQLNNGSFEELLNQSLQKDRVLEYTSNGIHKDDFIFNLQNYSLKKIGSQGQQKTFLVALKLAEFEFVSKHLGEVPILLLDDIFDKFDSERVNKIIELVADNKFGQIFITDTNSGRIDEIIRKTTMNHKLFNVVKGTVNEEK